MVQIVQELQDMTHLNWAYTRNFSGTAGSFLKAYDESPDGKIYYKLSNYDVWKGITGHECINEIIVDRLLTILGIEHLSYQLIHASVLIDQKHYETWLCASRDFKQRGESKIALDATIRPSGSRMNLHWLSASARAGSAQSGKCLWWIF